MANTYDPRQIEAVFGAVDLLEEPGEDAMVQVERDVPIFVKKVGAKGTATRNASANLGARVSITAMYTSRVNTILMGIALADQASGGGIQSLTIKDRGSKLELHNAPQAWIAELPNFELAREVNEITWVFDCEALLGMHGGR